MWELVTAVNELKSTYQSIDLRAVKFDSVDNKQWYCGFLTICFTDRSKEEILKEHDTIRKNSDVPDGHDLKVVFEYQPISQIERILSEINDKKITLEGHTLELPTTLSQGLFELQNKLTKNGVLKFRPGGSDKNYEYRIFTIIRNVFAGSFAGMFHTNKVDLNRYNIEANEFSNFFNLDYIPENINIVIIFPIYLTRYPANSSNEVIDSFYLHREFLDKAIFKVTYTVNGSSYSKNRELKNIKYHDHMVTGDLLYDNSVEDDYIFKIKISHAGLGDINEYQLTGLQINQAKEKENVQVSANSNENPDILPVFRAFNWYELFKKNLISKVPTKQVQSVTQLFSLLGFTCVNLGTFGEEGEQLTDSSVSHSADIIAVRTDGDQYIIDCTVNVPSEQKINKINNTCRKINQIYRTDFKPVVICGEPVRSRDTARTANVIIVDSDETDSLLKSLEEDGLQSAKLKLSGILKNYE